MSNKALIHGSAGAAPDLAPTAGPCLLVLFGASGDLTRRLLMPSLYNLACDGLLSEQFAVVGISLDALSDEQFRDRMSAEIRKFNTRQTFDAKVWEWLVSRLHYTAGDFADPDAYRRLAEPIASVGARYKSEGNVLFYLATPPAVFGLISEKLTGAGLTKRDNAWTRLIVEKPFGHDLASALALNRSLLSHWAEDQIYRIDHYLGKETVQNILTFRFANGIFEPVWNKGHVDHIQFTVAETVGVEGRGGYYDRTGVLRDMIQNHMFQMLAYLCMEPPTSLRADAIRNEKAKLLDAVRIMRPSEVMHETVRAQYGYGRKADGTPAVGYRQEPGVNGSSATETFAALRLFIDNWRWEGVPIYIRSGKALWKRGTEIVVQFRRAPEVIFRDTPAVGSLDANRLIFHVQPDQAVELRLHAKSPGLATSLQKVNMRFNYDEAFEAPRGTGYEVLLYRCMTGDATLFSRADLVETAWRIAQPILDVWGAAPTELAAYPAGSWGPKAAFDLLARDGRRWVEVINRSVLEKVPLFQGADPIFLHNLGMMLRPVVCAAGATIIRKGDVAGEMYFVCRGQAEAVGDAGEVLRTFGEGDFFGEISLMTAKPRTATVRAVTACDLFALSKADFEKSLKDYPRFASAIQEAVRGRYPSAVGE